MFVIEKEELVIYPVAFNLYIDKLHNYQKDSEDQRGNILLTNEGRLDEADIRKIQKDIGRYGNLRIILIDFQNFIVKDSRNFSVILADKSQCIVFVNLSIGIFEKVATDLKISTDLQDREQGIIYSNKEAYDYMMQNGRISKFSQVYCDYVADLISECLEESEKEHEFLESSCVFSNKYVNIRKIFQKPEAARFMLYSLSCKIKQLLGGVGDYKLICTSKTGAIIANIISHMLNIPVVYCVGVGPKFAVKPEEIVGKVQEHEKYIYIFDFICMGTELKILSTFISDRKSRLICGVGPASYIRCDHPEISKRKLILSKMHPLINMQDYPDMDYKIEIP